MLRRSDEQRRCGVGDGSALQVASRMRGGGRHTDKKSEEEKKQAPGVQRLERKAELDLELNADSSNDKGQKTNKPDERGWRRTTTTTAMCDGVRAKEVDNRTRMRRMKICSVLWGRWRC